MRQLCAQGRSEEYLGRWLRASGCRDRVVVSTKVAGPAAMNWLRGGPLRHGAETLRAACFQVRRLAPVAHKQLLRATRTPQHRLDAAGIRAAAEASLLRLGVDCIDLLSLHWPDRYVPMFGDVAFDAAADYGDAEPIAAQLGALAALVAEGKVREVGLSNETPWGLMRFAAAAAARPGSAPRVAALQNAYSLTCRGFESGLAECCHRECVSLVAYSPLAMGLLTGKYTDGTTAGPRARLNLYAGRYAEAEGRYSLSRPNVRDAVCAYAALAKRHGMAPAALAMRFAAHAPGVACALTGATEPAQLAQLLAAVQAGPLPEEALLDIEALHERYPNPTP
jgi:aryl-alcohol dehydrogenase-like predicted oxidoreductase